MHPVEIFLDELLVKLARNEPLNDFLVRATQDFIEIKFTPISFPTSALQIELRDNKSFPGRVTYVKHILDWDIIF